MDRRLESDAFEPTVQYAQVGSKMLESESRCAQKPAY